MGTIEEGCYGVTALSAGSSPLDFSYVFRTEADAKKQGSISPLPITNERGVLRVLYVPEHAVYNPGRMCVEVVWRLLHECAGNRVLHAVGERPIVLGNVYIRGGTFQAKRSDKGYMLVNAGLPRLEDITDGLIAISPPLEDFQKEKCVLPSVQELCEDVLDAHRGNRLIDPDARFEELLEKNGQRHSNNSCG